MYRSLISLLLTSLAAVSAVSEALRQSNAQFCSADVLGRLSVKLRSSERGDIGGVGWDVFLLDYAIDSPLHATRQNSKPRKLHIGDSEGVFHGDSHLFTSCSMLMYIIIYIMSNV